VIVLYLSKYFSELNKLEKITVEVNPNDFMTTKFSVGWVEYDSLSEAFANKKFDEQIYQVEIRKIL